MKHTQPNQEQNQLKVDRSRQTHSAPYQHEASCSAHENMTAYNLILFAQSLAESALFCSRCRHGTTASCHRQNKQQKQKHTTENVEGNYPRADVTFDNARCGGLPDHPRVDVALDDDKTIQENGAQQHEHAHSIGQHNVARHHCCAAEDAHAHLMRHKNDGPVHEEPALRHGTSTSIFLVMGQESQPFNHSRSGKVGKTTCNSSTYVCCQHICQHRQKVWHIS